MCLWLEGDDNESGDDDDDDDDDGNDDDDVSARSGGRAKVDFDVISIFVLLSSRKKGSCTAPHCTALRGTAQRVVPRHRWRA